MSKVSATATSLRGFAATAGCGKSCEKTSWTPIDLNGHKYLIEFDNCGPTGNQCKLGTCSVDADGNLFPFDDDGNQVIITEMDTDTFVTITDGGDGFWYAADPNTGETAAICMNPVKTVNGIEPDANGNVAISIPMDVFVEDIAVSQFAGPNGSTLYQFVAQLNNGTTIPYGPVIDTNTFGTPVVSSDSGTDFYGVPYDSGARLVVFPGGFTVCIPEKVIDTDTDTFAVPGFAPAPGTDDYGVAFDAGDQIVTYPNGSVVCIPRKVTDTDTFGVPDTADVPGTDFWGTPYAMGDKIVILPGGQIVCVPEKVVDTDTDTWAMPGEAPEDGVDAFGVAYSAGDNIVVYPNGAIVCVPDKVVDTDTDTFGTASLAESAGTDVYGADYDAGDKIITMANGDIVCVPDKVELPTKSETPIGAENPVVDVEWLQDKFFFIGCEDGSEVYEDCIGRRICKNTTPQRINLPFTDGELQPITIDTPFAEDLSAVLAQKTRNITIPKAGSAISVMNEFSFVFERDPGGAFPRTNQSGIDVQPWVSKDGGVTKINLLTGRQDQAALQIQADGRDQITVLGEITHTNFGEIPKCPGGQVTITAGYSLYANGIIEGQIDVNASDFYFDVFPTCCTYFLADGTETDENWEPLA